MTGWISVHRKMMDNPQYFSETFCRNMAWIDLLMIANHKPATIRKRGVKVDLKRGDIGFSYRELAFRWRWSVGRVIRFLNELECEGQIVTQKNNVTTCISIKNYDTYQLLNTQNGTQVDTQTITQTEHRQVHKRVLNNNDNNVNNDNKGGAPENFLDADRFELFGEWTEMILAHKDQEFEKMLYKEKIELVDDAVKDHLSLLGRYPKMQPSSQQAFRQSVMKHMKEFKPLASSKISKMTF